MKLRYLVIGAIQFFRVASTGSSATDTSIDEPWFFVGGIDQIAYFTTLEDGVERIRNGNATTRDEVLSVYSSFSPLSSCVNGLRGYTSVKYRAQQVERYRQSYLYVRGSQLVPPPFSDQELFTLSETLVCVCLETTFARTVNDRYGDEWLFSDSIDDDDDISLQHKIVESFEVARQAARLYYVMYLPKLVQTFDRFYTKCIGDKIAALDTN